MIKSPPAPKCSSSCSLCFPAVAGATFSDLLMSHSTQEDVGTEPAHWPEQLKTNTCCYFDQQQKCQCICNIFKDGSRS